ILNPARKESFSAVLRAGRAVAGLASIIRLRSAVSHKMGSSRFKKTLQDVTFRFFTAFFIGDVQRRPRLDGRVLWGETVADWRTRTHFAVRQDEVRLPRAYFV
ncbi:MAG: hypothetical protein Q7S57_00390, partial [bacterium]|nr:hypothetical protein [bacterium]